ncbi:MAG: hypothetical protein PVSMB7_09940 [Chloroflexota bacterium]
MSTNWIYRDEQTPFYGTYLRPIGAVLDQQAAHSIHVLETTSGFSVRHAADGDTRNLHAVNWTYEDLIKVDVEMRDQRVSQDPKTPRHEQNGEDGNTYQQVLRALGNELDTLRAYSIALDELEEQFLLTYSFQDSSRGLSWTKKMALVGPEEHAQFLVEHRSRRTTAKNRRRLWFR